MVMRPAAFVAAVALIAAAGGFGAYLALRSGPAGSTLSDDALMASRATDVAMPVDATEQVVELTVLDPEPPAPAQAPPPDEQPAERRVAERQPAPPPPPPAPQPAPEPEPPPAPRPEPVAEAPTDPEPAGSPDADAPAEGRDVLDGLPEIDGWRRAERSPEPAAAETAATGAGTADAD